MKSTAEWIAQLESQAVPCGPINRLAEVFADPQVLARGLRIELPHPAFGSVPGVANPIRLSASPISYRRAPPTLGEHQAQVLADWLGR
jgi:crotonobetainyl-CoA:carnitine CoA-transferase CaiB-like acyl-CoA transferase